jgi:hypothetical protein
VAIPDDPQQLLILDAMRLGEKCNVIGIAQALAHCFWQTDS